MQTKNKVVLLDIDHTIFNTELYRKKLYENLGMALGLMNEDYFKILNDKYLETKKEFGYFKLDEFLKKIYLLSKRDTSIKMLQSIFEDKNLIDTSLFQDVKKVLMQLKSMNIQIGIFSTGELTFQTAKIEEIKKYLKRNHIYIVSDKFKIIKATLNGYNHYKTYLVDDYPQVLESAKIHNKNVFTVFMKRKESYPFRVIPKNFKPDATITNLSQLIYIIKTNN